MDNTLYWKCPECECMNPLWDVMETLECPDCGTAPSTAIEDNKSI